MRYPGLLTTASEHTCTTYPGRKGLLLPCLLGCGGQPPTPSDPALTWSSSTVARSIARVAIAGIAIAVIVISWWIAVVFLLLGFAVGRLLNSSRGLLVCSCCCIGAGGCLLLLLLLPCLCGQGGRVTGVSLITGCCW